jgi:hypothetical protein
VVVASFYIAAYVLLGLVITFIYSVITKNPVRSGAGIFIFLWPLWILYLLFTQFERLVFHITSLGARIRKKEEK